jgi:hypothetical protein
LTAIAGAKESSELVEGETDGERVLNQSDAVDCLGRIHPIAVSSRRGFARRPLRS